MVLLWLLIGTQWVTLGQIFKISYLIFNFILIMFILYQRFMKHINLENEPSRKELIAQKLLLRGKIKKCFPVYKCVQWSKEL